MGRFNEYLHYRSVRTVAFLLGASLLFLQGDLGLASAESPEDDDVLRGIVANLKDLHSDSDNLAAVQAWLESQTAFIADELKNASARLIEIDARLTELQSSERTASARIDALQTADQLVRGVLGPEFKFDEKPVQEIQVAEIEAETETPPAVEPPAAATLPTSARAGKVDFDRDIRPIFADNCLTCHGPDDAQRKAKLRLDDPDSALKVLKPGDPDASELFKRITTSDLDDRMPPPEAHDALSPDQIALIRDWIKEGAHMEKHWAFVAPERPALPDVKNASWPKNEIDRFLLAKLESEGLAPSPETDKRTLIRRLSFDLLGLPPTVEEVNVFLNDESPDAYEKLVDRYLASKHYGERMAMQWLDLARYADSDGYHMDFERSMWQYRDWVINAFNNNKPFDEFTLDQVAGDLLPNPSNDQLIATAFNRNGMTTTEGGADPAEYATKYVIDRVNTTGAVWLGLTVGCAECHDHKYDPISQKEYYQLYDYFNQIPESGLDKDPCPPYLSLPTVEQEVELARLKGEIGVLDKTLTARLTESDDELDAAQLEWEEEAANSKEREWVALTPSSVESTTGTEFEIFEDGSLLAKGPIGVTDVYTIKARTALEKIGGIRLEALTDDSLPNKGPGRAANGNIVLTGIEARAWIAGEPGRKRTLLLTQPEADHSQESFPVANALDGEPTTGWALGDEIGLNREASFLVNRAPTGSDEKILEIELKFLSAKHAQHTLGRFRLSVSPEKAPQLGVWHTVGPFDATSAQESFAAAFGPESNLDLSQTFRNGELAWVQHPDWKDGEIQNLDYAFPAVTYLYRNIFSEKAQPLLFSFGSNDGIQAWLNGVQIHSNDVARGVEPDQDRVEAMLEAGDNALLVKVNNHGGSFNFYFTASTDLSGGANKGIYHILQVARENRDATQTKQLREHFRLTHSEEIKDLNGRLTKAQGDRSALKGRIPTIRIMEDMEEKRPTHVLVRGDYRKLGEKVTANVPAFLEIPRPEGENNRLALAKWLVDPRNPLVSRVAVNRFWQKFFGTGLVKTGEDFGTRSERPSHPALLDWLAVEFRESGWDIKAMQRLIVTSAAYRQSSKVDPGLSKRDPGNRLLARGPRSRLPAELVRDNALAISGLLDRTRPVGGPSVKPYQPYDLWKEKAIGDGEEQKYVQDHGDALYRRGIYTFLKRSVPYPALIAFDAPNRETCSTKRDVTNTPLQAFVTLNETTFVEAARHFAEKIVREGGDNTTDRLHYAYEHALARPPKPNEVDILAGLKNAALESYTADVEAASEYVSVGESPVPADIELPDFAAWTTVASTILNLDEAVTKE
jgi:mono/diheme cytochrome c family protein